MMESAESLSCMICIFSYLINYSHSLTYYVPEDQPKTTLIGNIARDADIRNLVGEEEFRNMQFRFLNLDDPNLIYFSLNSSTSDLRVDQPLDRETICQFSTAYTCPLGIVVVAQANIGSFFKKIPVTVNVQDKNDHPPEFQPHLVTLAFSESEIIGKYEVLDGAYDRDSSNITNISYQLITPDVPFRTELFPNDDGSSELRLMIDGDLDREKVDNYFLEIVAKDGETNPLIGTLQVNVTIVDDNDNKPVFDKMVYNTTVKENIPLNTTILTVAATDDDIGKNAEINYRLSSLQPQQIKDMFEINDTSGEVKVISHLEYNSDIISIKIEAVDNGERQQTARATIEVTVEDSENNPPEINVNLLSDTGFAETTEFAGVGATVAHVEVQDSDGGRNGIISCETDSEYFHLQSLETKEYKVTVRLPLDREQIEKHNVTITCHDFGVPRLNASAKFIVKVNDENDNEPVFSQDGYTSLIQENNILDYTVVQVYAKDADSGLNGLVSYYLNLSDRGYFSIDAKTGLIKAVRSFDRETMSSYNFTVIAVDSGNPQLSSSTMVSVQIEDQNDNAPVFDKEHYTYYVPETEAKSTVFGKVSASDADTKKNISYSIVGNKTVLPFEVLPDGNVKTRDSLDREKIDRYDFNVMAIDNGFDIRLSSLVGVTVIVSDINDNYPVIHFPQDLNYKKNITYMMPAKTQIMKIEASDADEGPRGELIYQITKRNDTNMFEVGRKGEVYVARRMTDKDIDSYSLDIMVFDKGNPPKNAVTRITIVVLDKNVTDLAVAGSGSEQQNIIIAVVVIVVTVVIAASIIIIIWVVRRNDMLKRKYEEDHGCHPSGDNDSGFSSNGGRKSPDALKMFGPSLMPSAPVLSPVSEKTQGRTKDVKFQDEVHVREKSVDSTTATANHNTVQLHRLASLRLQQALIQNRPWTSQNELNDNGKDIKRQEDIHSDMSADTATYDSGIGGSVSDTGDLRLTQLQQIVRQSGRRGQPPHKCQPSKPPRILARGRSDRLDQAPERPPPIKNNPYRAKSPVQIPSHFSPATSPTKFTTSSPTPISENQSRFMSTSPTMMAPHNAPKMSPTRHSPSRHVVQDLLMYKKFQNGLKPMNNRLPIEESVDTTYLDDDESTTSGSYYIDNPAYEDNPICDMRRPPVSDIYV